MTPDSQSDLSLNVSTRHLVIETPNPLDLSIPELSELAAEITGLINAKRLSDVRVTVKGDDQFGAGNNWIDILQIILPSADFIKDTIYTAILSSATEFMRKRFKRKHEETRPRRIDVRAPDGRLLMTLTLATAEAQPEVSAPAEQQ